MRIVYFDLETGGVEERHPITQLAAVAVDSETWKELDAIEIKLQFDVAAADPEALKINHYDAAVWREHAVPARQAIGMFGRFLEPYKDLHLISRRTGRPYSVAQLAGHNAASFDGPRILKLYRDAGVFLPADPRVLDTMQRALWWFQERGIRPESYRLEALCNYFLIPMMAGETHDALADVRLTVQLAKRLSESNARPVAA